VVGREQDPTGKPLGVNVGERFRTLIKSKKGRVSPDFLKITTLFNSTCLIEDFYLGEVLYMKKSQIQIGKFILKGPEHVKDFRQFIDELNSIYDEVSAIFDELKVDRDFKARFPTVNQFLYDCARSGLFKE